VLIDGTELDKFQPWRNDCPVYCTIATFTPANGQAFQYCMENPCGNTDSVQAPRANWCPGTFTPPKTWDPAPLHTAGPHQFTYAIDNENTAAGATWRVSATLFAFGN
jgi:hypothetical protein